MREYLGIDSHDDYNTQDTYQVYCNKCLWGKDCLEEDKEELFNMVGVCIDFYDFSEDTYGDGYIESVIEAGRQEYVSEWNEFEEYIKEFN